MLQNANSSSSSSGSRSSGNNCSKDDDGDTDGSSGSTGGTNDNDGGKGRNGGGGGGGGCGGGGGGGGGGAFQPVKPRSVGNLSPTALRVESTTTTTTTTTDDEAAAAVVGRCHIDEMAVDSSTPTTTTAERRKKKPYKELTLEEKVQLIRLAEENAGMSQASIAERYSIAKSNVCRILQRKHEYLRAYEWAGFAGSRKRKLRGDPQQHHPQQQQHQQSRGNARNFSEFRSLKMANVAANCTVPYNHSTNHMELTTLSGATERSTTDSHLIAPQRPTTIIHQRGNIILTYVHNSSSSDDILAK
ncbi:unnamed protein product [Litomosoides sigmodontis]|uniref:HTH psq-type domain-containing protein n=1 Tax=Litomosoides sigmodontis TaxID=42156 RepID=A0A3P6TML7_LITSI|nr:unnamed protein product [Litomosoides sigmodontis]